MVYITHFHQKCHIDPCSSKVSITTPNFLYIYISYLLYMCNWYTCNKIMFHMLTADKDCGRGLVSSCWNFEVTSDSNLYVTMVMAENNHICVSQCFPWGQKNCRITCVAVIICIVLSSLSSFDRCCCGHCASDLYSIRWYNHSLTYIMFVTMFSITRGFFYEVFVNYGNW